MTHTKSISFQDKKVNHDFSFLRFLCMSRVDWKQQLTTSFFLIYRMSETLIGVIARKLGVYVMLLCLCFLAWFDRKRQFNEYYFIILGIQSVK